MITRTSGSFLEKVELGDSSPHLSLVHNDPLERIMFDRNLAGVEFRRACLEASRLFIDHLMDEFDPEHAAELMILSKGLVYQLAEAVATQTGKNLPTNLIATSRVSVSSDQVKVEIPYAKFEAPSRTLLVGDTVASGATIVAALEAYRKLHPLDQVFVVSYAGTLVGARKIEEYCRKRAIKVKFLFGLAAFGLADNGFDLSFLHPETVCREEYRRRAAEQFAGIPVSAIGWDFGSQAMAPQKYRQLCWIESEMWKLQGEACFKTAEQPHELSLLRHEEAAYSDIADTLRESL
ncbi:hypothetical protein JIX56_20815 [Streptomyces sp. CA-210063]|uniref:hypothetical protein n=1 Tax=Streptomyces sp. CA-210063 TaxID=2801029 RepID=UPI00214AA307|nr:hypothetical protein [Streptomyces sp. CA-210063]UUU32148.1 hypothetical protein JIX56_20815 [Streptomyces sp. CA-210063]